MRHVLWALALLATLTLTAAAQRGSEGAQPAGGGTSGGSSDSSPSASPSGGSSSSGGGSYDSSPSVSPSSGDRGGGWSGGGGSEASSSRDSSGGSSSSRSSGGSSAPASRADTGSSRGSSPAPVRDDGPSGRPTLPNDKQHDKKPKSPPPPAPATGSGKGTPTRRDKESDRLRLGSCDLPPWDPFWEAVCGRTYPQDASSHPQGAISAGSCDWLLRQVEQEELMLAQLDKQRSAACGQDPGAAECKGLSAAYQQFLQRVQQAQNAYNRCQAGHP